jgi:ribonuclease R
MKLYLKGGMSEQKIEQLHGILPEIAKQCSERERMADEAERETEDLKKVEYMKNHEGEIFEGVISNVTNFGMFIELENTIEGLVRMSSMEDDYYNYDDRHFCLIGERTHKTYRVGDVVKVILAKADVSAKKIEFLLVESEEDDQFNANSDDDFTKHRGKGSGHSRKRKTTANAGTTESDKVFRTQSNKTSTGSVKQIKSNSDSIRTTKKTTKKGKAIDKKVLDQITGKRKRKRKTLE